MMGQISAKLRRLDVGYGHWCPACMGMHAFFVDRPTSKGHRWRFNGDVNRPTFTPSMNIRTGKYADPKFIDTENLSSICHYILTAGRMQFCGDCTHALRGQSIDLPDLPPYRRD